MALQVGYGEAVMHFSITGGAKPYTTTCGFGDGSESSTKAQDCADSWFTSLTAATDDPFNAAVMFTGWVFEGVSTLFRTSTGDTVGAHFESVAGTASTGSPPGQLVDPYNPVTVSKRTFLAGRHHRGRMYVPPVWVLYSAVDPNGTIDGTLVGFIQGYWNGWLDDVSATDFPPVVNHLRSFDTSTPDAITSVTVRNVLSSQRRRKARSS